MHLLSQSTQLAATKQRMCRRLGIPDSNIILMLPDDMACNPRNPHPGQAGYSAEMLVCWPQHGCMHIEGSTFAPLWQAILVRTQPAHAHLRGWPCAVTLASVQQVFNNKDHGENLYGEAVEVDYRGYEVTAENFLRVLTGL